jgi:hypothetical protein
LLKRFGATADPATASEVAWALVRITRKVSSPPRSVSVSRLIARMKLSSPRDAQVLALAQLGDRLRPADPKSGLVLGTALYRAGRFDEAVQVLDRTIKSSGAAKQVCAPLVMAIVCQMLGQPSLARSWLEFATADLRAFETQPPPGASPLSWADRLDFKLLRSEAEAIILYDPIFPANPFAR